MSQNFNFAKTLLNWYDVQGRKNLPWRENITAYKVWVSEIMLQQTQVKTVIDYFHRFMQRFPTIHDLAHAHLDEVLNLWTGLGYYARARNLHKTAICIVKAYKGIFPNTLEALQALPGIGKSTAGAILAISFEKKATILDGNVKRVLTRFHAIDQYASESALLKQLWDIAERYTPKKRVGDYTQAIMDLGATLCTFHSPACSLCPLMISCTAHAQSRQAELPIPKKRKALPQKTTQFLIIHDQKNNKVLLKKRPPLGIWGGLWSFPECDAENFNQICSNELNIRIKRFEKMSTIKHVFTHFELSIVPVYINKFNVLSTIQDNSDLLWYSLDNPASIGLSSPVVKLLNCLD